MGGGAEAPGAEKEKAPLPASKGGARGLSKRIPAATYSPTQKLCSTIGSGGLNFRVRDGNGWNPSDVATGKRFGGPHGCLERLATDVAHRKTFRGTTQVPGTTGDRCSPPENLSSQRTGDARPRGAYAQVSSKRLSLRVSIDSSVYDSSVYRIVEPAGGSRPRSTLVSAMKPEEE